MESKEKSKGANVINMKESIMTPRVTKFKHKNSGQELILIGDSQVLFQKVPLKTYEVVSNGSQVDYPDSEVERIS